MYIPSCAENDLRGFRVASRVEFRFRILNVERSAHDDHLTRKRDDGWIEADCQCQIRHGSQREKGNLARISPDCVDD
jgi:hypothetical protein